MLKAILIGGLVAGVLDILYAIIIYGPLFPILVPGQESIPAIQVLQSVAGGWIGREATQAGGWSTAVLGLGTHFMLATIMAAVFVIAAQSMTMLTRNAVLWGLLYGLGLYVVMNYIVVPLSSAGPHGHFPASLNEAGERLKTAFSALRPKNPLLLAGTVFTHTVLVGLPIALIAKKFAGENEGG